MIFFDKTEFILGNIKHGSIAKAVVSITNNSSEEVEFTPANSSCSCTTGVMKLSKVPPKGKTEFTISLNTLKAGKGMNIVKSIQLSYKLNRQQFAQIFRIKANIV